MRYTRAKSRDWAEFRAGAAELSMAEIMLLWSADSQERNAFLLEWLADYAFFNRHGASVVLDTPAAFMQLTPKQYDWLRQSLVDWTRDEDTGPEV